MRIGPVRKDCAEVSRLLREGRLSGYCISHVAPGDRSPQTYYLHFCQSQSPQGINDLPTNQEDSVRLRREQLCPIHRSVSCCGREVIPKERRQHQMGVRRIDDPQHPRGYRELRSNGEIRKLLDRKIVAQNGICGICKEKFTDYSDIVPDHIPPAAWAALGGTITPTTFRPCTGGATVIRDRVDIDVSRPDARIQMAWVKYICREPFN